jgi:hypothetical protein
MALFQVGGGAAWQITGNNMALLQVGEILKARYFGG